jgi:polyisoprenoid-binding protein YceI
MKKIILAGAILAAAGLANAQEVVYDVEPTHTFVHFEALHSGTSTNRGRFDTVEGSIMLDRQRHRGKVDIVVRPASVSTGIDSYDDHLRHADFLHSEAFPVASFQGSGFLFENDQLKSVTGTFTLLGKPKTITLNALRFNCYDSPRAKTEVCGGDFETTLARSDYGMEFGLPGIPDQIHILIQIEAVKR